MRSRSPAILTGLLFDDRGNPMTPSHTPKRGVRYRYYVSHALLQGQKDASGSVSRVSAPEVEALVLDIIRPRLEESEVANREVVRGHIKRVTVRPDRLDIHIRGAAGDEDTEAAELVPVLLTAHSPVRKGITSPPSARAGLTSQSRDTLLQAIARAHRWMDELFSGAIASTEDIASAENLAERHVRFLLPLAFLSPRIITAIADGSAPSDLTVSALARALPHSWSDQESHLLA